MIRSFPLFWGRRSHRRVSSIFDSKAQVSDSSSGPHVDPPQRKPSQKVEKLVDDVLGLTLIECADLCDMVHEKLSLRGGASVPTPFPNPQYMFQGMMPPMMGGMPPGAPMAGMAAPGGGEAPVAAAPAEAAAPEAAAEAGPSVVSIKLTGFDAPRKVQVVKEVRALLNLGLREAKEFVEAHPKVLKKGVTPEEAQEIQKKMEAVGGLVEIG